MRLRLLCLLAVTIGFTVPAEAKAHYHMLLPDKPAAKTGEVVTLTYQFGHPYEHELFDTQAPQQLFVLAPDGTKIDLTTKLEKQTMNGAEGKKVTAFRATFTPEKRGDHVIIAVAAPVTVPGEKHPLADVVKVIIHVQTQNGWDRQANLPGGIDPRPLTRPYGLVAGMAFRVEFEEQALAGRPQPVAGALVEVERYNATPPKELPPDEHITRAARTDRVGTTTVALTEPGWWAITAIRDTNDTRRRGTLWVHVDDKVPLEPAK